MSSESVKSFVDMKTTLRNYTKNQNILLKKFEPTVFKREPELSHLYYLPNCPASTSLVAKRDPITGKIVDYIEVTDSSAEENAYNSSSLKRMPNPLDETVRGSIINYPFWPGGLDKPDDKLNINELKFEDFNFDDELLTVPPDFDRGYTFDNYDSDIEKNNSIKDNIEVNLLDAFKDTVDFDEWLAEDENKNNNETNNVENTNIKDLNVDNNIIENNIVLPPILEISKTDTYNIKSEWVEKVDTSPNSAIDFEKKIPEPAKTWVFELDPFQKQAILKIENHEYVFVAAHTSAGKTVVAEYAIALSKRHLTKTVYTSPIKALSNQKYRDFKKELKDVGLITGDLQIEPTASCLIMTTEILRSMLYCGSDVTRDLEFVILDEVHYINDIDRGHVWEEVLILLPEHVTVIMLSATVSNVDEFASWVGSIKKRKVYVISTYKRPVPLMHYLYTAHGQGKVKDNIHCIVNSESKFLFDNYGQAQRNSKPRNNAKLKSAKSIWKDLLEYLRQDSKLPVIVFILSRKRCDDIAQFSEIDLNTEKQKKELNFFFNQCLKKLKEPDRELPQFIWMKNSLEKGIGVHHSGILPILKEIVEMCFQRGLVKVLFATETFAMGVNMPAKTVVFESIKKFDGLEHRLLKPSEYIQMAGRAGRRGHDDSGKVIILCKDKDLPDQVSLQSMILGKPEKLKSKFVLRYAVLLTCLRTESVKVENIISHSYLENELLQQREKHEEQLKIEKENLSKLKEIDERLKPLCDFYDVAVDYLDNMETLMKKILVHPKATKTLVPGRVVMINHNKHYNKLGIVLVMKINNIKILVLDHLHKKVSNDNVNKMEFNDKYNKWHKILSLIPKHQYFQPQGIGGHCVLDINLFDIIKITKNQIKCDTDSILKNWNERQMERFKDFLPNQNVLQAVTELTLLNSAYNQNQLQFYDFYDTLDLDNSKIIDKLQNLKRKLNDLLPYMNTINFESDFYVVYERKSLMERISLLEWKKSWKSLSLYPKYRNRLKVLKELGFVNKYDDEVELKGKIAREMSQNEIILTELISNNIIHGLDIAEIAALLSGLVFQGQTTFEPDKIKNDRLKKAIDEMKKIDKRIEEVENEFDVKPENSRLNFGLVLVVYEWAKNKPFAQIMNLTDVQEGIIVRCIQQLDEIIRDVKTAARRIGDRTLESKMEEVSTTIRRDIVFAASLYTSLEI